MASKVKSRRRESSPHIEGIRLLYPVLASCSLDRTVRPDLSEEEAERFYDCAIHPLEESAEPMSIAVCEFSAGQKRKDTKILEIEATYFLGFETADPILPKPQRQQLIEQLVCAAAWPLFRDLFIHIGSQSGEELPLLPNVPKVRWRSPDEEKGSEKKSA